MTENKLHMKLNCEIKMGTAIILTNGILDQCDAKTAHGLVRGTKRFDLLGVIDHKNAGQDAGEILDGIHRNIPVFSSVNDCLEFTGQKPDYCIVGVAVEGGILNEAWQTFLLEVMSQGISIINGMHMLLSDDPVFLEAAEKHMVEIIDIRRPKPFAQLSFWTGRIFELKIPRLAVLGTDCAIGKRTTCRMIMEACQKEEISSEMIYTGQTGWLQGIRHGFIFDATLNDFVSGELEAAIVECEQISAPDLILLEGQSGLRNPSGPCGSEFILSGNIKGVILQHAPFIILSGEYKEFGFIRPDLESEIKLIEMYGAKVLAISLNGEGGSTEDLAAYAETIQGKTGIPVVRPLVEGVSNLLPIIRDFMLNHETYPSTTLLQANPSQGYIP
jgi:uncharacterized NAD-dependent epimerase/dehydratase family protein